MHTSYQKGFTYASTVFHKFSRDANLVSNGGADTEKISVFFSAFAGSYALRNMYPEHAVWRYCIHFMAVWLPASWAYTFIKVPGDARMATARVLAHNQ